MNTTGSATGTGTVNVKPGGTLAGSGIISGRVNISATGVANMSRDAKIEGNVSMTGTITGEGTYNGNISISNGGLRNGINTVNGEITVKSGGTLGGEGYIKNNVTLQDGAIVAPGTEGTGKLTCYKALTLANNGSLIIEINRASGEKDQLSNMASVTLAGTLKVEELSGTNFTAGESYKIIAASKINGAFSAIEPATPGEGLAWDLSRMNTSGYIGIKLATSTADKEAVGFEVYPNPSNGQFNLSLNNFSDAQSIEVSDIKGKVVYSTNQVVSSLNLETLATGVYMLKIQLKDKTIEEKLIIK